MRVNIIEDESKYGLERKVTEWLDRYKNDEVLDIKYSGSGNGGSYSREKYSAMIILK